MMHFMRTHLNGNPYLGIFACTSDSHLLIPPGIPKRVIKEISEALEVEPIQTTIAGTGLVGTLAVANSKGLLLPADATNTEVDILRKSLDTNVGVLETRFNALGNLILVNDKGALVGNVYQSDEMEMISNTLSVKVKKGTINSLGIVGSLARSNNMGALVSPNATDEEVKVIKDALDVNVERGTANLGVGNVGICILANSNGVVAGMPTTGIEMSNIQQVFEGEMW